MKELISVAMMAIFLSGNVAWAEGTDFVANSTMAKKMQIKNHKSASVEENAQVYLQPR
ncbi:hypothetical protein [Caedibacter taeniospiralis]|jgi:hypothetical protein|uniref:hypothetical protein n=1 Tax=Caedibacter taeniospiralis TaxID=28907 RepID=UPI0037C0C4D1